MGNDLSEEEKKFIQSTMNAYEAIRKQKESHGFIECPRCGNSISFRKQHNGHIWAACKTENCIKFLQ